MNLEQCSDSLKRLFKWSMGLFGWSLETRACVLDLMDLRILKASKQQYLNKFEINISYLKLVTISLWLFWYPFFKRPKNE